MNRSPLDNKTTQTCHARSFWFRSAMPPMVANKEGERNW